MRCSTRFSRRMFADGAENIDISQCVEPKQFHDVMGYYNRSDVFNLTVTRKRLSAIQFLM